MLKLTITDSVKYNEVTIVRTKLRLWPFTIHRVGEVYDGVVIWKYFISEKRAKVYYWLATKFWEQTEREPTKSLL
jgi:hypothetical protein